MSSKPPSPSSVLGSHGSYFESDWASSLLDLMRNFLGPRADPHTYPGWVRKGRLYLFQGNISQLRDRPPQWIRALGLCLTSVAEDTPKAQLSNAVPAEGWAAVPPNLCSDKNFSNSWKAQSRERTAHFPSITPSLTGQAEVVFVMTAIFYQHCTFYICGFETKAFSRNKRNPFQRRKMLPPPETANCQHIFHVISAVTSFHVRRSGPHNGNPVCCGVGRVPSHKYAQTVANQMW